MANCTISTNGLLSLDIPSTNSASYYACATASNYTRLATCCGSKPHVFTQDPCYSWCDLPSSLNSEFDNCATSDATDCDAYTYMLQCLQEDPNTEVEALHCSGKPHVIYGTGTTTASAPTSTFNVASFCATEWPPEQTELGGVLDPYPGCAVLPNATNAHVLEQCCSPSVVETSVEDCYEYCALPRGSNYQGQTILTTDQALGSFKACMIKYASGLSNETLFGGIYCRANESQVFLNQSDFGTTQYLLGSGHRLISPSMLVASFLCIALASFVYLY